MARYAGLGAVVGALALAVPFVAWEIVQPHGLLRLVHGAAIFLLAPPYILLGTSSEYLLQQQQHVALYALATASNAALGVWLYAARQKRSLTRFAPVGALFAAWAIYVVVHG